MVHAAALSGLRFQLTQAGDEIGTHVAEVCGGELIGRLGLEDTAPDGSGVLPPTGAQVACSRLRCAAAHRWDGRRLVWILGAPHIMAGADLAAENTAEAWIRHALGLGASGAAAPRRGGGA